MEQSSRAKKLGFAIRQFRRDTGLTQKDVCQSASLNLSHYRNIEAGKSIPGLDVLDRIIISLGVEYSFLYSLYLECIDSPQTCGEFSIRCLEKGNYVLARKSVEKLFSLTKPTKIKSLNVEFIIIFLDK